MSKQDALHDPAAERAVLGAILVDPQAMAEVADMLVPEDFTGPNRRIYEACLNLWRQGQPTDPVTVREELGRRKGLDAVGGLAYLTALAEAVPTAAHVRRYAEIVAEKSRLRSIRHAANQARLAAEAGDLEAALRYGGAILDAGVDRGVQGEDLYATAFEAVESIHRRASEGVTEAVPTGLSDLDDRLDGGLWPADLCIVAARPGTGKTAFLLTVARHIAGRGEPVLFYSLEQSRRQLALRAVAAELQQDASLLRRGWLEQDEWEALFAAIAARADKPLHVVDKSQLTVEQMLAYAKVMQRRRGLAVVMVDYLQIVYERRLPGQSRAEQVAEISRKCKAMAKELNVPVLCAAQLNRRSEDRDRPSLADLRESGAIEQDADVVMFLWRPDPDHRPNLVRCTIAKHRNGATGELDMVFRKDVQRFELAEMRREATA
ncbi:MAG TPA: replicative DNA helicase [Calditerricola sp.]